MKVFAFHLLNDYSGSPKVLSQLVKGWVDKEVSVTLVTCKGRDGFLSNIQGASYLYYSYTWRANAFLRLINLFFSQLMLIFKTWRHVDKEDILYINTVLPFGAAVLGKLKGCRIIYHIHETSMKPAILKKFLFGMVKRTATDVIYVSDYLSRQEHIEGVRVHTLYNALDETFYKEAQHRKKRKSDHKHVLMVCSLKIYKGIWEFVKLAGMNPDLDFRLVVNASVKDIDLFFKGEALPSNLRVFPTQTNTHPFYAWADIVLNLSLPDQWIETFGLTVLEAMAYELPVIVPPVGGITELVESGRNGFMADSRKPEQLSSTLNQILGDNKIYSKMRLGARVNGLKFSEQVFISESLSVLEQQQEPGNQFHKLELQLARVSAKR